MYIRALAPALACLAAVSAPAQEPAPSRLSLIDGWEEQDGSRLAAIVIDMAAGWKTYWRVPGDAGIPPSFDWSGSRNLGRVELIWPTPTLFDLYGLRIIGYADRLVLPVRLWPEVAGGATEVRVRVGYGVCAEICIPTEDVAEVRFAPGEAPGAGAADVAFALEARPRTAIEAGVTSISCAMSPTGAGMAMTTRVGFDRAVATPDAVVVESTLPDLWIAPESVVAEAREVVAQSRLEYFGSGPLAVDRSALRVTLLGSGGGIDITGCPAPRG